MIRLYLNGKYTLQRTTGVQRVAGELVAALDRRIAAGRPTPSCTLLQPPQAEQPSLRHVTLRAIPGPRRPALWEQWSLPRAAADGLLLNLAGSAPAFARGPQACMLHDAAVFDHPEAYSPTFVRWYRWLFRRHARHGTRLLTVSAFSRGRLAAALGVSPDRFAIVTPGADHFDRVRPDAGRLAAWGLEGVPFLLAVASANPTKRLAHLVRVWEGLGRHEARLVIAGGSNPAVFAGGTAARGDRTQWLGPVDDPGLKALYAAARGLVLPSVYEGFGLPPLEAMACSCPVASSNAASLPEVCGDAALLFDPGDEAALAAAMRALLDDEALRLRLRTAGRAHAAGFRWDAAADALLAALETA